MMILENFINLLPDAKIQVIYFDFDAENVERSQDLVIIVSKLRSHLEQYKLVFSNTSSFNIKIEVGEQSVYPRHYSGDSMYIKSVFCREEVEKHQHWQIVLIDKEGYIDIFAEELSIEKLVI
ncbi:hypothetical protein RCZ04_04930 [Capnocytophaga sp. HP1101]